MPTARELLEQADALMRRNRVRTGDGRPGPAESPVSSRVVDVPAQAADDALAPRSQPEALGKVDVAPPKTAGAQSRTPMLALDDVPVLTDAVEEIEAPTIAGSFDDEGEPSQWLEVDRGEISITGPLPDSISVVPSARAPMPANPPQRETLAAEQTDEAAPEIKTTGAVLPPSQPEALAGADVVSPETCGQSRRPVVALDDVPVLTDVVEEIEAPTIAGTFDAQGEPSQWLDELALDEREAASAPPAEPPSAI